MPAVTSQIDLVGYLVTGLVFLIPGITALVVVVSWINRIAANANTAKEVSDAARERLHDLNNQVATFRAEVARDYASKSTISELRSEVLSAINGLSNRIDRILGGSGGSHS
jgi:hypothetical protein